MLLNTPRGTRDIVGGEAELFEYLVEEFKRVARLNGFKPIITPTIEYFELFARKSGEEIVRSMYVFEDKAGRKLALRPELTAPVVRAFLKRLRGVPRPIMLYYVGQCFRYEEPQKGRYREFWQAGLEVIGEPSIDADVKVIGVIKEFLDSIGVEHYYIVGNVGVYRRVMSALGVKPSDQDHILHLIDKGLIDKALEFAERYGGSVVEAIKKLTSTRLEDVVNELSSYNLAKEVSEEVYKEVEKTLTLIDFLKEFGARVVYEPKLVRGLAYYNSIIYEVKTSRLEASIGGGGRYDGLTTVYEGHFEYSTGAALGIDRVMLVLGTSNTLSRGLLSTAIIVFNEEPSVLLHAYTIARKLHTYGVPAKVIVGRKLSKALSLASREGYRYAVIIGPREVEENTLSVKDLEKGVQKTVEPADLLNYILQDAT